MQTWRFAMAATLVAAAPAQAAVTMRDVHGLTYSPDGKQLIVAVHDGLVVYENGKWSKSQAPQHDYMGFSATSKHFYSSGHPAPGSGLVNPLGVVRSKDGGRTWDKLGLEGERFEPVASGALPAIGRDAVAYIAQNPANRAEYAIATYEKSVYRSMDAGRSWTPIAVRGNGD